MLEKILGKLNWVSQGAVGKKLDDFFPYVLSFPLITALLIVFIIPLFNGIYVSFFSRQGDFAGVQNYIRAFNSQYFWNSIKLTFIYVSTYTVGVFIVGFFTALVLKNADRYRGGNIASYLVTLPYAIPTVVASLIWIWMFDGQLGVFNYFLKQMGLLGEGLNWLSNSSTALYSVLIATIWKLFPLHTMIILAAFRTVPENLYEAADIDGAGPIRKFFSITLPMTSNVMKLLLVLTVVWSFKRFTMLWLMTGGGPGRSTETTVILIYRQAFRFFNRPYATAIGTILLILVTGISVLYFLYQRRNSGGVGA